MSTPARELANKANAQHSTGPTTQAGKAVSSRNALVTGLTGRTVLLPTDDRALYQAHLAAYRDQFHPANLYESNLVQAIADTDWRLARIPELLLALDAKAAGAGEGTGCAALESYLLYEKQIRNIQLQEARLHRRRILDLRELKTVQAARKAEEQILLDEAAQLLTLSEQLNEPFDPAANGFEFSTPQIQAHRCRAHASNAPARSGNLQTAAGVYGDMTSPGSACVRP